MPRTCGPRLAKIPIRLEPINPPATTSAITSRLNDDVELVHELVEALVHEADLDLAVARLLQDVVHLVRRLGSDARELAARLAPRAARAGCGVYRSSIRSRAYGFATSKTLKSGYSSTPTEPSVAIALSSRTNRVGSFRFCA